MSQVVGVGLISGFNALLKEHCLDPKPLYE